jgi:hypothetical protein
MGGEEPATDFRGGSMFTASFRVNLRLDWFEFVLDGVIGLGLISLGWIGCRMVCHLARWRWLSLKACGLCIVVVRGEVVGGQEEVAGDDRDTREEEAPRLLCQGGWCIMEGQTVECSLSSCMCRLGSMFR